nr:hypothetical protein [Tanacetum cinerariifolium]
MKSFYSLDYGGGGGGSVDVVLVVAVKLEGTSANAVRALKKFINTASTSRSGTLPGNTIANPKGELKAITTQSGLVTEGHIVPNPPKPVNPEEDECVEETYTDPDHAEYNIKVPPPPPVQKPKP